MAPSNLPAIFNPTQQDIEMLLAAQCHLGSKNLQVHMEPYLWKTRADGVNVLNVGKTWEKIVLAARIIAAIDNPADSQSPFRLFATSTFLICEKLAQANSMLMCTSLCHLCPSLRSACRPQVRRPHRRRRHCRSLHPR
jgi:hypothetical protein